jgi:hypothetical protein
MRPAVAAVEEYVVKSKRWEKGSYEVEFNRKEGTTLVFWVIHSEDKTGSTLGKGKSIEVHVDPISNTVVKEFAFQ